jgi:3-methyladenine DNA glycosylase AlkC
LLYAGCRPDFALEERLKAIYPLADDSHFGVREWAWLGLRPHLARELDRTCPLRIVDILSSERVRRFACESLRPRGVWCAHISALKQQPQRARYRYSPLRADPSAYVQDSVANWLNDAGKDSPEWFGRSVPIGWLNHPHRHSAYLPAGDAKFNVRHRRPPGAGSDNAPLHAITRLLDQLRHLRRDFAIPELLPVARINLFQGHAD